MTLVGPVALREYVDAQVAGLDRRFSELRAADELRHMQLRQAAQTAVDAALTAAEKAVLAALAAVDKATKAAVDSARADADKTERGMEHRLELLNELRKGVATSDQLDGLRTSVGDTRSRLIALEAGQQARAGGLRDYLAWIVVAITVIGFVISRWTA